jgi:hypothetical protein
MYAEKKKVSWIIRMEDGFPQKANQSTYSVMTMNPVCTLLSDGDSDTDRTIIIRCTILEHTMSVQGGRDIKGVVLIKEKCQQNVIVISARPV